MKQYRQGDVLIVQCDPSKLEGTKEKARDNGRIVLAYGEVTGHAHAIHSQKATQFYKEGDENFMSGGTSLLKVDQQVTLTHEEHDPIDLPPGTYEVRRQHEYQPGPIARRMVED